MSFITIWAILATMILSVLLGFIWYGPLFGKQWMELSGIKMPEEKPSFSAMLKPMILSFIGAIFMSYTLGFSIAFHNAYYLTSGFSPALSIAFLMWLGFMVPVYLNLKAWEGKSWKLFWINAGYWLVFMILAAVLIVLIG